MAGHDFLLEIGVEELPAAAAASALEQAGRLTAEAFETERIGVAQDDITVWVTPRRIAITVRKMPEVQDAEETAERGPAAGAAFGKDGNPTKAAQGFARAKGLAVDDLEVREHNGQEFVFAVRRREGKPVMELLPGICRQILTSISFPKTMRWDGSELRFSRPVRWLLAKYGDRTVEFEIGGIKSGSISRGHRFLSEPVITIESATSYEEQLAAANVMVDQEKRRQAIKNGLIAEASRRDATYSDPAGELEEVVYLVEHPTVLSGSFKEKHLRLPDQVLVTAMQSHQRYFPMVNGDGAMLNGFLYVMNGDPAHAAAITEGNQRILEGRIEDAEFSYDKDLDTGIEAMAESLGEVVFHRRLGSLADKAKRLGSLAGILAERVGAGEDGKKTAVSAARMAKADLVSVMVQEFPDLEGYIGSVYAEMEGYPSDVCHAIAEQYLPVSADGELPATVPGALLAICDKIDNLVGAFSVDELPTGSRDPYGLRRAAVGISEISMKHGFVFDLASMLSAGHQLYIEQHADVDKSAALVGSMMDFVYDRLQHRQVEKGMPVEVFEAARASREDSTLRMVALSESLDEFRNQPEFEDLHTAYFRCSKIAAKAGGGFGAGEVDPSLFQEPTEEKLYGALEELEPKIKELIEAQDYPAALAAAATIRPVVDQFFDDVLVMAEDEALMNNRLGLVSRAAGMLSKLGDPIMVAAAPKDLSR